jgi:hypothetical protein
MNGLSLRTHRAVPTQLRTKKFWEELITYFPLILHGLHGKRKIGGRGAGRQTDFQLPSKCKGADTHRQQGDLISLLTKIMVGREYTESKVIS